MSLIKQWLLVLAVALPVVFFSNQLKALEYSNFKLYNGLEFYLIKTKSPVITYTTWVNAGGIDEGSKQGVAHFLEHMMFRDNKKYTGEELNKILYSTGGEYNALTNYDYTIFYEKIPFFELPKVMQLEASRMRGLSFKVAQFNEEKKIVLEERGLRIDNNPISRFTEQMDYYALPSNNYRRSLIGSRDAIQSITLNDLKAFYNKFYRPDNIKIFVVGNISQQELRKLARKYYSRIYNPRDEVKRTEEVGLIRYPNQVTISIIDPAVLQNIYSVGFLAPSLRNTKDVSLIYSLRLLQMYMNSQISAFYQDIVKKSKLANDISVGYNFNARLNTTFNVYLIPVDNSVQTANKLLQLTETEIKKLKKQGIPKKDLSLLITQLQNEQIYLQGNESDLLFTYANFIMNGFTTEQFENITKNLSLLKADEINKNIQNFLSNNQMITKLSEYSDTDAKAEKRNNNGSSRNEPMSIQPTSSGVE